MANEIITQLNSSVALTAPASGDVIPVTDVSDTTEAATGTTKPMTLADTTKGLSVMAGDSGSGGTKGLVPAPAAGDAAAGKFLKADGSFAVPSGTGAVTLALTAAHGSDDTYTGITVAGLNAGATIAQWEAVYLGGSSTWLLADANGSGTFPARGLAIAAYINTNPATILVHGTVRNDAWNWTPGGTIYMSGTAGALTQTAPSTSGDNVQQVGFALTADIAFFDFNNAYLTVT